MGWKSEKETEVCCWSSSALVDNTFGSLLHLMTELWVNIRHSLFDQIIAKRMEPSFANYCRIRREMMSDSASDDSKWSWWRLLKNHADTWCSKFKVLRRSSLFKVCCSTARCDPLTSPASISDLRENWGGGLNSINNISGNSSDSVQVNKLRQSWVGW